MTTFDADILQGTQPMLRGVKVYLEETVAPNGMRSWFGAFQLSSAQHIEPGGPYRIQLSDKRGGDIIVTNVTISSTAPIQVSFVGSGPLA